MYYGKKVIWKDNWVKNREGEEFKKDMKWWSEKIVVRKGLRIGIER